jgi:ribonuclease HII
MQEQEIITDKKNKPKNRKVSAGSTFNLEKELAEKGYNFIIGVDEAGRGPLCGPVVAAAVVLKNINITTSAYGHPSLDKEGKGEVLKSFDLWDLVRDSKKLSEKQREKVFDFIQENFHVGVGLCNHETIDRINILEASFLAMKKAVQELKRNVERITHNENDSLRSTLHAPRYMVLVDGNKIIPNFSMQQKAVIGGDKIVKSISAASIIAKVTRDRMMMKMHEKYPEYGFDKHKGYGTKLHMAMLEEFGPCEIHRKSFAPVTRLLHTADRKKP